MKLPIPDPIALVRVPMQAVASIETAIQEAIGLVPRLSELLDQVTGLVARVQALVTDIEATHARVRGAVERVESATTRAEAVIEHAGAAAERADLVIDRAGAAVTQVEPLITGLTPALTGLQPVLTRLADTTSPGEVDAAVALVNELPDLVQRLHRDILPVLDTLGTVAPDLHELLEVSRQLNEILGGIPGLGRVKKRVEEEREEEQQTPTEASG